MTTICYQTTFEHNIIQFPKKPIIQKNDQIPIKNTAINYDVYPAADRFDPNMSSSPPNAFISTLKQRMDVYYSTQHNMQVSDISNIIARNRTLSWEHK